MPEMLQLHSWLDSHIPAGDSEAAGARVLTPTLTEPPQSLRLRQMQWRRPTTSRPRPRCWR